MDTKNLNDYERGAKLGSGAFGTVQKAIKKSDGKVIALKIINLPKWNTAMKQMIEEEVKTLKRLSFPECHPFIVCYYGGGYDETNEKYLIEMELIEGQDMFDFVQDKSRSDEALYYYLLLIASDVSNALEHIHSQNILHNDIKLENIMIQKDTNIPKLIDFGLACNTHTIDKLGAGCTKAVGTPMYLAPEFFQYRNVKLPASDMWALGLSLYSAVKGEYPYTATTKDQLYKQIRNNPAPTLNTSNILLNDITNGLLVKDPRKRLTPSQVIKMIEERNVRPVGLGSSTSQKLPRQITSHPSRKIITTEVLTSGLVEGDVLFESLPSSILALLPSQN